jgi:hypothetical protein
MSSEDKLLKILAIYLNSSSLQDIIKLNFQTQGVHRRCRTIVHPASLQSYTCGGIREFNRAVRATSV